MATSNDRNVSVFPVICLWEKNASIVAGQVYVAKINLLMGNIFWQKPYATLSLGTNSDKTMNYGLCIYWWLYTKVCI